MELISNLKSKLKAIINKTYIQKSLWVILLMLIWQVTYIFTGDGTKMPSLLTIFSQLMKELIHGELLIQIYFSLLIIAKALLLSIILAFTIAYLSYKSKLFNSFFETLASIFHPLPGVALLPLVVLWIGVGQDAILFIIIHSILWPLAINVTMGFNAVPKIYKEIAKNYELNGINLFLHILAPSSIPYFISGMKIGWSRAWRALISAEMLYGALNLYGGLGWFVFEKRIFMNTAGMLAGLLAIILIGIFVENTLFRIIEKRTIEKWGMK